MPNPVDNCPTTPNPAQVDNDGDGQGDTCDNDDDNDSRPDANDNCPLVPNFLQENNDGDSLGDACDPDDDNDTVTDAIDNCPLNANATQADNDNDGAGDACDVDDDNDLIGDLVDNCPFVSNPLQVDADLDGLGDHCDGGTSISLNPAADSFVRGAQPGVNYGSLIYMRTDQNERALMRFDISSIPAGSTIVDATMILCLSAMPPVAAIGREMDLRIAQDPWTENGVTWANQPGSSGSSNASFFVPGVAGCVSFTVKDDVESWMQGEENYGWVLADADESSAAPVQFHSREASISGLRPTLTVTFSN